MITLRCTRKLLERLGIPPHTNGNVEPTNALGDWYANLIRVGRESLVVAMSERSCLMVLLPARDICRSIASELPRTVGMLLRAAA